MLVGFIQGDVSRHPQVHLYGDMTAYAAGTQMMHLTRHRFAIHYLHNLLFQFLGQALLKQFASRLLCKMPSRAYDEHADTDSGNGVEHSPPFTEQDSTANAHCRSYRRHGVAAVVPRVGNHSLRVKPSSHLHRKPVCPFLQGDAHQCSHKRNHSRLGNRCAANSRDDVVNAVVHYHDTHEEQCQSDERRCQCLVFPVSVGMVAVLRL